MFNIPKGPLHFLNITEMVKFSNLSLRLEKLKEMALQCCLWLAAPSVDFTEFWGQQKRKKGKKCHEKNTVKSTDGTSSHKVSVEGQILKFIQSKWWIREFYTIIDILKMNGLICFIAYWEIFERFLQYLVILSLFFNDNVDVIVVWMQV